MLESYFILETEIVLSIAESNFDNVKHTLQISQTVQSLKREFDEDTAKPFLAFKWFVPCQYAPTSFPTRISHPFSQLTLHSLKTPCHIPIVHSSYGY